MKKTEYVKGQKDQTLSIIQAQKESGLSVSEWCAKVGITKAAFYYHASRARKLAGNSDGAASKPQGEAKEKKKSKSEKKAKAAKKVKFLEVDLTQGSQPRESGKAEMVPEVVVEFKEFKILVGGNASRDLLANVMEVVAHV